MEWAAQCFLKIEAQIRDLCLTRWKSVSKFGHVPSWERTRGCRLLRRSRRPQRPPFSWAGPWWLGCLNLWLLVVPAKPFLSTENKGCEPFLWLWLDWLDDLGAGSRLDFIRNDSITIHLPTAVTSSAIWLMMTNWVQHSPDMLHSHERGSPWIIFPVWKWDRGLWYEITTVLDPKDHISMCIEPSWHR